MATPRCQLLSQPPRRAFGQDNPVETGRRLCLSGAFAQIMRALIQRVGSASVSISGTVHSRIGAGLLILLGIEEADTAEDVAWLAGKIAKLRIFSDAEGHMNLSIQETGGEALVVSQFTLHAATKKGNRPSFLRAARPEKAIPDYEAFCAALSAELGKPVQTGVFGADMQVALLNDGPVTIWMDSQARE
jgi:D-aminoacyl-tRNA deacylase